MDLHAISLRVAGQTLDVIRDIGVFDKSLEPQFKATLQKMVDGGTDVGEAAQHVQQLIIDSAKKIWPYIEYPLGSARDMDFQNAIWDIEATLHEVLHEGVDKEFGLGKTHPVQDLLNEVFIGTVGAKPTNVGLDSLLGNLPTKSTVGEWLSRMESTLGGIPKDVRPVVQRALKKLRRSLSDDMGATPWMKMYGPEYERIRSKVTEVMESFEDPGLEAVTAETDKEIKLFVSILVSKLKKV
jgi:hypothetical protein